MTNSALSPFPIIAILGPTAVGKTSVAIRLAKRIRGEIVNLDSVQIYKGLDIGSAKPTKEEQAEVKHHLIDILEPDEVIDATIFATKASFAIKNIIKRGKVPILVGGTGFYLRSIFEGLTPLPSKHPAIRNFLNIYLREKGRDFLYNFLMEVDKEAADKIHKNDTYRLIRALEVYMSSSIPFSVLCKKERVYIPFRLDNRALLKIGLITDRDQLYKRIDDRVEFMVQHGFIDEVKDLLNKGYNPKLKPLQSIGYRHIISYLLGNKGLADTIDELKRDTRHYAKRQITWFKKEDQIRWFNVEKLLQSRDIWKEIN